MVIFHSWFTVVLLVVFIGIVLWAYSGRRKKDFDEAAQLPFRGEDRPDEDDDNKGDRS